MHFLKYASGIALLAGLVACYGGTPTSSSGGGYAGGSGYGGGTDAGTEPVLAFVDPGRTLNATPGQGVGVFVTYQSGGQWLIQWTCDTSITQEPCFFEIAVHSDSGSAAQLLHDSLAAGGTVQNLNGSVTAIQTTTTTEEDQAAFGTAPGATITVNVELNGQPSGQYFFFVQNGLVNGGYQGSLNDPLEFEPTSP
jgi:hypothetical protein